jgi:phosphatidylinositol 3,5-bisphosphate 5-phosphatase
MTTTSESPEQLIKLRHPSPNLDSFELQPIASPGDFDRIENHAEDDHLPFYPQRHSVESAQSYELYTPDEERRVLRKLDRRLVSFMALLYCLSFLDRSSE